MYTKQGLEESRRQFIEIAGLSFFLPDREKTLLMSMIDVLTSHIEAYEEIEYLRDELRIANEAIDYWANR